MVRTLIVIGAFVLAAIVAVWYFSSIFIYISLSLVLATLLRPMTNKIAKFEFFSISIPRPIAILISFSAVIGVITAFVTMFIPLFSDQIEVISKLNFDHVFNEIFQPIYALEGFLLENDLVKEDTGFLVEGIRESIFSFLGKLKVTKIINGFFSVAGSFFVGLLAVTFITFFLLFEDGIVRRQFIALIPNAYFEVFISALYKIERLLSNYLLGLLFQMVAVFSVVSVGLTIVGVDYAVTIGVFAAVANLIPYLGPLLGGSFGIIVAVSTSGDLSFSNDFIFLLIKVFSVFATVQVVDNVLLQPLIFSKSVKAHPLEIFVIIFVGATIAGIPGMVAAIPVYTIVRVSSSEIYAGFNKYRVFKTKS